MAEINLVSPSRDDTPSVLRAGHAGSGQAAECAPAKDNYCVNSSSFHYARNFEPSQD
jgi:hypothetical protein